GLVVITQLQPIDVVFTLPEQELPAVLRSLAAGMSLPVYALDRTQQHILAAGSLAAVDSQIDPTTGTVKLKALFDNETAVLFPNQFVNASLELRVERDIVVVPTAAIRRSGTKTYTYVVTGQTAAARDVVVGPSAGDEVAIESGLSAGEKVVVD